MKSILTRVLLLTGFTLLALVLFLPSTPISGKLPAFWTKNIPKIILGLDLQGGLHLVLDVDKEKAVENYTQRLVNSAEGLLRKRDIPYRSVKRVGISGMSIETFDENTRARIEDVVKDEFSVFGSPTVSGTRLTYNLNEEEVKRLKDWAHSQALETIRNRIDKFGVSEPLIQRQGDSEIAIQLPGLKDTERAIKLIGKTAVLEFRLVDDSMDPYTAASSGAPPGSEILYQKKKGKESGVIDKTPFLVKKDVLLTGDALSDARVAFDTQTNEPYVSLNFDSAGGRAFERITSENVGKRLAIVLDGNVHSAPVIREAISGGRAQISGGFTREEARDLAIVLRAGALPAPVTIVQNVTVGPTLGADSIRAGVRAALLGGVLVLLFMVFYYKVSGLIADFAIVLNMIMLLGAMAWVNATLTLPGIAGIILTIGMGVDSNVLIFERIKEELRGGHTPRSAINAGYDRAWWTIVDSHVTTLITAAVLFQFGSGPIKGFAVTLSLGILTNLFTALVGTKVAFDIQSDKFRLKKLSI
ncbi:MAG: protein translocase subunit SecD [Thermodesulfobacteriota bacterium]|nr:MAG: protein translocase subunit SecD [Thermodesulfobacteriota bacterium]